MSRSDKAPFAVAALSVLTLTGALAVAAVLHEPPATDGAAAGPPGSADPGRSAAAAPGRLSPAASCDDLLDLFHEHGSRLVGPWGWHYPYSYFGDVARLKAVSADFAMAETAGRTTEQSSSATGTNVQEAGIDEPDVAKTDGDLLVRVDRRKLTTYDVSGKQVRRLGSLDLPKRTSEPEVLLHGDRALIVDPSWRRNGVVTRVLGVDLADPTAPSISDVHEFEGELLSARLTGGDVRLVIASGLPDLDFVHPTRRGERRITGGQARRENRRIVRESTIDDWLPQVSDDGSDGPLLGCAAVNVPDELTSLGLLNVVGFPFDAPTDRDATAVLTDSRTVYTAADRLYLATSGWRDFFAVDVASRVAFGANRTDVHSFALAGTEAVYLASGRLRGTLRDRWSLDSVDGVLRVALAVPPRKDKSSGERVRRHNAVVTMQESDGVLEELGRVDGLGPGEDIQSVRWFDDFAVVVTFRQVDPLYAVDLTSPARPRLLGELKIPGFSSYLHPIGGDRLLGIGTDATLRGRSLGPQASIFDVSDPAAPTEVDKVTYGRDRDLPAAWEPRQFTWLPEREAALTPVHTYRDQPRLALSVLKVGADGALSERRLPLAGGWRAGDDVRTLPLSDGRVIVTSSAETRFLDW